MVNFRMFRSAGNLDGRLAGSLPVDVFVFQDTFEGADFSASSAVVNDINLAYSYNRTGLVTQKNGNAQMEIPSVINRNDQDWTAKQGDYSILFDYAANVNMAEHRFTFDAMPEVWMKYWIRVPVNYTHGDLNNKFLSIWQDVYDAAGTVTIQTRPNGSGGANIVVQDGGVISGEELSTPFISVPADRGRWMEVAVQFKSASSSSANDGEYRLFRRWESESFELIHEYTGMTNQYSDGAGYRAGYFMGWANDPYTEDTYWLLDDIRISQTKFSDLPESNNVFTLGFENGLPINTGSGDGALNFFANPANGAGSGIGGSNITVETASDPLFGTVQVLRDTYFAGGDKYTFGNQTMFLQHSATKHFSLSSRVRFSANWEWGSDQLKFCKNKGSGISTNCPKFDSSGEAFITKLAPANENLNEQNVRAVQTVEDDYNISDDLNNGFGVGGNDAAWVPNLDQWYTVKWEIDAGTLGQSDGSYKLFVDDQLYMQLDNVQVGQVGDSYFTSHELGHVWQNGSPTQDIYIEFHSIKLDEVVPVNTSVQYNPFLNLNFNGTDGDTGTTEFASSTDSRRFYSTEKALAPQTSSLKFTPLTTGNIFGGRLNLPTLPTIVEGSNLWLRSYQYLPNNFCAGYQSGSDGYGDTKWLRIGFGREGTDADAGRFTLQLSNFTADSCSTGPILSKATLEGFGGGSLAVFPSPKTIPLGQWSAIQFQIYFHPTNGFVRAWVGEDYAGEYSINTMPLALDKGIDSLVFGNYWNGKPAQDTELWTQDIIATVETPNTLDLGGRPFISPSSRSEDF
jgi:hypothetical protein